MRRKIITIIIITIFLLIGFSSLTVSCENTLGKKANSENSQSVYINPECVGFSGSGYAYKSFWLKRSNTPYIVFCHYDGLEYGFIIDKKDKRIDFEGHNINVIVFGFSFGQHLYSYNTTKFEFRQAYCDWFGFLEPNAFGGLNIDIQNPFYVILF